MKKILLVLFLFLNLIPTLKDGEITLATANICYAQNPLLAELHNYGIEVPEGASITMLPENKVRVTEEDGTITVYTFNQQDSSSSGSNSTGGGSYGSGTISDPTEIIDFYNYYTASGGAESSASDMNPDVNDVNIYEDLSTSTAQVVYEDGSFFNTGTDGEGLYPGVWVYNATYDEWELVRTKTALKIGRTLNLTESEMNYLQQMGESFTITSALEDFFMSALYFNGAPTEAIYPAAKITTALGIRELQEEVESRNDPHVLGVLNNLLPPEYRLKSDLYRFYLGDSYLQLRKTPEVSEGNYWMPLYNANELLLNSQMNYHSELRSGNPLKFDSFAGTTVSYLEAESFFNSHSDYLELVFLEETELIDPVTAGTFYSAMQSMEFLRECNILRRLHPHWSESRVLLTAYWNTINREVHFMLDVAGFVPVIGESADLVNGAIYFLEGDKINAALSASSAVPIWGWVSTGGKWVRKSILSTNVGQAAGKIAYKAVHAANGGFTLVRVAVGNFTHSLMSTIKYVRPADKTLRNLGKELVQQNSLRYLPTDQAMTNIIDDIAAMGDIDGTKTEALADLIFSREGFTKKFNSKVGGNNGFDNVYIKEDANGNVIDILINESKQVGPKGNISLSGASSTTQLPAQMSDDWLRYQINLLRTKIGERKELGDLLAANFGKIKKVVTAVDKTTKEVVILKLANY